MKVESQSYLENVFVYIELVTLLRLRAGLHYLTAMDFVAEVGAQAADKIADPEAAAYAEDTAEETVGNEDKSYMPGTSDSWQAQHIA